MKQEKFEYKGHYIHVRINGDKAQFIWRIGKEDLLSSAFQRRVIGERGGMYMEDIESFTSDKWPEQIARCKSEIDAEVIRLEKLEEERIAAQKALDMLEASKAEELRQLFPT